MEARDLRVGDAEREHVGRLLQRAVGNGMLSLGEFTERMDTALAAKTRGELNAVLVDLPGLQIADSELPAGIATKAESGWPASTDSPSAMNPAGGTSMTLRGTMSTVSRKGQWTVPPELEVVTKMSTVTLDFTSARLTSAVVTIRVDDYCSTTTLVVPDDATVDLDGLEAVAGSASNKVASGPPRGRLHLVVHGKTRFGSVTAKHSFGSRWRLMTRS